MLAFAKRKPDSNSTWIGQRIGIGDIRQPGRVEKAYGDGRCGEVGEVYDGGEGGCDLSWVEYAD